MREKRVYTIIYIVMLISVVGIVIWSATQYGHRTPVSRANLHLEEISGGWTNVKGEEVDVTHLQKIDGVTPGNPFSVYHQLPGNIGEGKSLCFRSKNIIVKVYVNGHCLYESDVPGAALNSEAVGTNWNYVDLPSSCAGKQVEFRVTTTYAKASARIDNVYIGSDREFQLKVLYDKLFSIATCLIFLFVGVVLLIVDIPLNAGNAKAHDLLYLGLFAIIISLWCLMETYSIQMFSGDARTVHITACCLLMLIPIPTIRYLYEAYGDEIRFISRVVIILSCVEFFVNVICQLAGLIDFQQSLFASQILLIISAVILFVTIMKNTIQANKGTGLRIFKIIRGLGLGSIAITTGIDIVRYYVGNGEDAAKYVRLGGLLFFICYAGASLEKSIDTIRLGAKAEVISQLAYQDGLTGLGNRTLFNERMEALNVQKLREQLEVAIVMFDVNDLKLVNDHLGHQLGDEMLKKSADIIRNSYGSEGECFRIGGDEFVVIVKGSLVQARCEMCQKKFKTLVEEYNQSKHMNYRIRIASGFSIYDPSMGNKDLREIYKSADAKMYADKKQIKAIEKEDVIIINNTTTKLMSGSLKNDTRKLRGEL